MDFYPLWLSMKVAFLATLFTFVLGLIAAQLTVKLKYGKGVLDGLFTLPLVLPPTVVGFFLLIIFGKNSIIGQLLDRIGASVIFSWTGAVIASTVVSFPLMYRTSRGAFEQIDENLLNAGRTLGMTETELFFRVTFPNSIPSVMAGTILAFARALGEFGATIMLAGNIPHRTQTVSIAIYSAVQGGDWNTAYQWTEIIICISFAAILLMNWWTKHAVGPKRKAGKPWH
ncbi:MAG TPA: molybdate ABC transporter permease subunit [Caproicibacter sp.]|nr:molybdate ABC transporter permease subunit [Caproicibacter sp.]